MSDLQIGLLIIGIVTIAAVVAYNKIQDLKFRRLAEKNFTSNHDDALLEPAEISRQAESTSQSLDEFEPAVQVRAEPARIEPTLAEDTAPSTTETVKARPSAGDECDAIFWNVQMTSREPMSAGQVARVFDAVRHAFSKPTRLLTWNQSIQSWIDADAADVDSSHFSAGIQLVDRQGPVNADDLADFHARAIAFASDCKLVADPVDPVEPQERARKIDDFCCDVDIQIVLHLVSPDKAFAGTKIRAIAEADGFQMDSVGLFRRLDEDGHCLYSLANGESGGFSLDKMKDTTSSSISLQFDLPRAPGGIATFDQFCISASRFAATLGGRLVDDNQVEIGAGALKSIREQVGQVQARMSAAGFPPGSLLALKLFS
jgi:hypothetical protein